MRSDPRDHRPTLASVLGRRTRSRSAPSAATRSRSGDLFEPRRRRLLLVPRPRRRPDQGRRHLGGAEPRSSTASSATRTCVECARRRHVEERARPYLARVRGRAATARGAGAPGTSCASGSRRHKRPREVRFVDELPKTPIGKLDRRALETMVADWMTGRLSPAGTKRHRKGDRRPFRRRSATGRGSRRPRTSCDVTDERSVAAFFERVGRRRRARQQRRRRRPCAARPHDARRLAAHLDVNATGAFLCTRAVLAGMIEPASMGASSPSRRRPGSPGRRYTAAYTASKHAAVGLMRCRRGRGGWNRRHRERRLSDVRATRTMTERSVETDRRTTTGRPRRRPRRSSRTMTPLGRLLEPDEVAFAVRFLASPEAAAINGQTLVLDGGGPAVVSPFRGSAAFTEALAELRLLARGRRGDGHVSRRPDKLNALTFDVYATSATCSASCRTAAMHGARPDRQGRGFCSGGDVEEIIGEPRAMVPRAARLHADERRSRQGDARFAGSRSSRRSTVSQRGRFGCRSRLRLPSAGSLGLVRLPLHPGRLGRRRHGLGVPAAAARRTRPCDRVTRAR